jgi:3-methyladenine DNA glycosylase AlkD
MPADSDLIRAVRDALAQAGDPERAAGQQRYMKSPMPFRGVRLPRVRTLTRSVSQGWRPDRTTWEATVRELWDRADYREERYAAVALARAGQDWLDAGSVPLFRHLLVTGAWWDLVDEISQHLAGTALAAHPAELAPVLWAWSSDDDMWVRRCAVICQVGRRTGVDTGLLRHAIEANLEDPTFWLRKAIGWALRDYARTDPGWVRAELDRLGPRLSALSRREAAKHLG